MFRSLRSRNYRLFFVGQLTSQVGNWTRRTGLTLLVLELTDNGVAVGLVTVAQFVPILVLGPWSGVVADRYDKRRLMFVAQAVSMVSSFGLAVLAFLPEPSVVALYLVALGGGFAFAFDNPARRSLVAELVPQVDITNAVSLNSALTTGGRIVGPAVAGLMVQTVGYGWCFVFDGVSYLAVLGALALMRQSEMRTGPRPPRARGQAMAGLRYALDVPELRVSIAMVALVGTLAMNFPVVLPLFVTRSLGESEIAFTVLYSTTSVGAVLGALIGARRTAISVGDLVFAAAGFGVALVLLAAAPNLVVAYAVAVLLGLFSTVFMTAVSGMVQLSSTPSMRGRVASLESILVVGSSPIGGPTVGAVCEYAGARAGLVVGGVACFGAALWGATARRRQAGVPVGSVGSAGSAGSDPLVRAESDS